PVSTNHCKFLSPHPRASDDGRDRAVVSAPGRPHLPSPTSHTTGPPGTSHSNWRTANAVIGYRHGLRASELCDLQWSQVELASGRLHVRRAKNGSPSVHPMQGDEIRALRRLQREQGPSSHVFMTERDGPMTPKVLYGEGSPLSGAVESRHNLVCGRSKDRNHDAVMRIGSEAPNDR